MFNFNKKTVNSGDSKKIKNIRFTILAIFCIVLFCGALAPVTFQNDTFYAIKIGEHITQVGKIDMQDPFSWHDGGLPYVYPHWLYDVMIFLIYNLGGFTGIFVSTIIFSSILGIVMYFANLKISKNRVLSFLLTLGAMYLLKDYITARAQLVTFILFEVEILLIENFLTSKKKIFYAIILVLISLLIANLHCAVWPFYFVLFLPYIGEYICNLDYLNLIYNIRKYFYDLKLKLTSKKKIKEYDKVKANIENKKIELEEKRQKDIDKQEKRRANPYKIKMVKNPAVKWLIVVMIVCALMGLIVPNEDTPYTYLYKTMQGNTTKSISEHQPLTLINDKPMMISLAVFIALLVLTDVKIRLKDLFMLAGLTVLMFMTQRQSSMFIIFGVAILAKILADLFEKYDKNGTEEFTNIMLSTIGTFATVLIIALFMLLEIKGKVNDKYVDEKSYPVQASEYIKNNIDLKTMRLYNEYNYGSYLLYQGIPVFIDSRAELYAPEYNKTAEYPKGRDIFSDYINTSNISKYYETTFREYNITHIILYKNSKLNMLLSKDPEHYKELYSDKNFVFYERDAE